MQLQVFGTYLFCTTCSVAALHYNIMRLSEIFQLMTQKPVHKQLQVSYKTYSIMSHSNIIMLNQYTIIYITRQRNRRHNGQFTWSKDASELPGMAPDPLGSQSPL